MLSSLMLSLFFNVFIPQTPGISNGTVLRVSSVQAATAGCGQILAQWSWGSGSTLKAVHVIVLSTLSSPIRLRMCMNTY